MSIEIARGVCAWDCPAAAGHPICVADMFDHDDSLSVSVYLNDEGIIVGVMVYDANSDLQSAVGLLPLESINEERSVLGVPEIGLSTFLPASEIWA